MEKAVITGMGAVSPIGNTIPEFEKNLFAGRHGIVPCDHFDTTDMAVNVYAPVTDLDINTHFPPREARRLDRHSLFALISAREAAKESGILDAIDPFRIGVNLSTGLGGVDTFIDTHLTMQNKGPRRVTPMLIPKFAPNMSAGLVAIDLGARGPSTSHSTACAAGTVSIGEGMRAIRHGYVDAMICGGADAATQKLIMAGFQSLRALSTSDDPDRASIPFDKERKGFVMGEGGGAVVLESETHARARGATILAEVSGYGLTSDASHITAPDDEGEAIDRAITDALSDAGERDETVYVNAHGTGTAKNDAVEAAAIARVFGDKALVSSTKSMTGHLLGAAGAVEAIAGVMALQRGEAPPTAGTTDIDDDMHIDVVRGESRSAPLTRSVSLSLGFGGHNACLVIDRPGE
ncbi:beta-ketoacyl-[acyl-carrier-protein] synthase family protein [Haloglycomyces albus]|uniref:beta-ketoacyl-[acyl-carrier-protein] synthase family protein n=1 Tax=Haloglycomyces albus TaxID=526067 RepID=UPI0004A44252|nr:beta-ketoacyl-[acyl-carrier-protein] synthase family protein [Haloglycomyces albus]